MDRARNFAQSQNGDLAVYSSDAEADAITAWFGDLNTAVNANDADTLRGQIDICDDRPKVCAKLETTDTKWWSSLVIGAKKTGDAWSWVTSEEPVLLAGNDPLAGISADAALASDYLITSVTDAGTSGVRTGSAATTDQVPLVLIELPTQMTLAQVQAAWDSWEDDPSGLPNSAILNPTFNADPDTWLVTSSRGKIDEDDGFDLKGDLTNVYWGEVGESVVDFAVNGYSRDFNKMPLDYTPLATTAPESAYPFVAKLEILDGDGAERADQRFAAEPTVWRVTFNRDMDQTIQPLVTYGPAEPFTDFTVAGNWVSARVWQGNLTISPIATDGYQYVRIAGAVAADDAWLTTGVDRARFRFEVNTSGVESLNLQATGGEGYVDLSWNQDDYETMLGFNIYRSESQDSGFTRINQTLVGDNIRTYRDENTQPGVTYYYYFTVAVSGNESEPSNTASATAVDTEKPVISHTVATQGVYQSAKLIQADVTDNIGVNAVTLYYRAIGATSYISLAMNNSDGNTYVASIPGSAMLPPGVQYYIEATDGASFAYSGRANTPNTITVENSPVVTNVSPSSGSQAGGTQISISGNNFVDGAQVLLGAATCQNVVVESSSRILCTTPANTPETVAVRVTNPNNSTGILQNAFTFIGNATVLSLPDVEGNVGSTLDVALTTGAVAGLQSFSTTITFNSEHIQLQQVRKGALVSAWEMVENATTNSVTVAAASSSTVTGSGELLVLEFTVLANGDANSPISITSARLNDGSIAATTQDGSFTAFAGFTVGGTVKFWDDAQTPVSAVITLDGGSNETSSEVDGSFAFARVLDGQRKLVPSKDDEANDSVRLYDASLILSQVVGTANLSANALIAADVTGNGIVTEQDAAKILEVAAGLKSLPFANIGKLWTFSPNEISYDGVTDNITDANFTAIFMGDVSGNWANPTGLQTSISTRLVLDGISNEGIATVNVFARPPAPAMNISAFELLLATTPGASLIDVAKTQPFAGWTNPHIVIDGSQSRISLFDDISGAFSEEMHILTLRYSLANGYQSIASTRGWLNETKLFSGKPLAFRLDDDMDGDWVPDHEDAFPDDVSASEDTDGDGMPDNWNPGYSERDSESGLVLDLDDDNDGYTDKEEVDAGTNSQDASDQPVFGMNIILFKMVLDKVADQTTNSP